MNIKYLIPLLLISNLLFAQEEAPGKDGFELKEYYYVLLKHGPNRSVEDTAVVMEIQRKHLVNIDSLYYAGKLVLAGPFGDKKGGGIFILNADSMEEAINLCESDPAIQAGRLIFEIRPWWTDKNSFSAENREPDLK